MIFESEGKTGVYLGDLVPTTWHLRIKWTMGFDQYPVDLIKAKEDVLARMSKGRWLAAFEHDPKHCLGYIEKTGKSYSFTPLERGPAR